MSDRITRRSRVGLLGCVLLLGGAGTLTAQSRLVGVGDTIRVDLVQQIGSPLPVGHWEGVFAGRKADTVFLRSGNTTLRTPRSILGEARVQRGSKRSPVAGMALGLLASTILQVVWVTTDSFEAAGCQQTTSIWFNGPVWGNCRRPLHSYHAAWFMAGALGGAALGYRWKRPHWLKAILP